METTTDQKLLRHRPSHWAPRLRYSRSRRIALHYDRDAFSELFPEELDENRREFILASRGRFDSPDLAEMLGIHVSVVWAVLRG